MTEAQVRAMRDRVYDHRSSDNNWLFCRKAWMNPEGIRFLQAHDFPVDKPHLKPKVP